MPNDTKGASAPLNLDTLRAALAVIQRETVRAGGVSYSDGRDLIATHAAVSAALAELTARRARDAEVVELVAAMRMAIRQNSHDMLMTGEELRRCTAALLPFQPTGDKT